MYQHRFPEPLPAERLAQARLAPNLAVTLGAIAPGSTVAEVGVRQGELTEALLKQPSVARVIAIDHFTGQPNGKPHLEWFQERFARDIGANRLEVRRGRLEAIKGLGGASTSAFFLRGSREHAPLLAELYMCDSKLRPRGLIWVADYIMADYTTGQQYETVRAVNEFVAKKAYDLLWLVLENTMFCTVVLRRPV